jgi:hypothetical protein
MRALKVVGVVAVAAMSFGCVPDWARDNETGIIMEISRVGDASGFPGPIFVDVRSTSAELASVLVNVYRKNPDVSSTSPLEHVRLESYQVQYFRSDGRNVEGLDVPYRTTGALGSIRFHTPTDTDEIELETFIPIVRETAKLEPPLVNLVGRVIGAVPAGRIAGEGAITTMAEITVYARQVTTGEPLHATGRVQVVFTDFGPSAQ